MVYLNLSEIKLKYKNMVSVEIEYKYIKNAKLNYLVSKGSEAELPEIGHVGSIEIRLTHFCTLVIRNERNYSGLALSIIELLKFKLNNKEIDDGNSS